MKFTRDAKLFIFQAVVLWVGAFHHLFYTGWHIGILYMALSVHGFILAAFCQHCAQLKASLKEALDGWADSRAQLARECLKQQIHGSFTAGFKQMILAAAYPPSQSESTTKNN